MNSATTCTATFSKASLVQAGITFVGFWAADWVLHYAVDRLHMFEMLSDFANLPLLMLVATVFPSW